MDASRDSRHIIAPAPDPVLLRARSASAQIVRYLVGPDDTLYADLADGRCLRRGKDDVAWSLVSVGTCG